MYSIKTEEEQHTRLRIKPQAFHVQSVVYVSALKSPRVTGSGTPAALDNDTQQRFPTETCAAKLPIKRGTASSLIHDKLPQYANNHGENVAVL